MRALFLSRFDSFTKAAISVSDIFLAEGIICDWVIIESKNSKGINYHQYGIDFRTRKMTINALINDKFILKYDYIVIYDTGGMIRKFIYGFVNLVQKNWAGHRPIIISGYAGVSFSENQTGFSNRSLCDYVFLSNKYEYELYRMFCKRNNLQDNGLLWGWNFFSVRNTKKISGKQILFADQNIIPFSKKDRLYLANAIILIARSNPSIEVIVKSRTAKGEKNLFKPRWSMAELIILLCKKKLPKNLKISYGNIEDYLANTDLLITMSSTAAIQALMSGIRVAIISDFGKIDGFGTTYFDGSGCLCTIKQIIDGYSPKINEKWLKDFVISDTSKKECLKVILDKKFSKIPVNFPGVFSLEYLDFIYKSQRKFNFFLKIKHFFKG